jgi:hypothetical protein
VDRMDEILSRIIILNSGDLVVTDLWDEVRDILKEVMVDQSECSDKNL